VQQGETADVVVSFFDRDSQLAGANETFTVTLAVSAGILASQRERPPLAASTITQVIPSELTISGTLRDVQGDLNTLTMSTTASGPSLLIRPSATAAAAASDDAPRSMSTPLPVTTAPLVLTAAHGVPAPISGVSVVDPDGDFQTITITALTEPLSDQSVSGDQQAFPGPPRQITIFDTLSEANTVLSSLTYVSAGIGTDTIDIFTDDRRWRHK